MRARIRRDQQYTLTQEDENAGEELARLYSLLQLSGVVEHNSANLVIGSVDDKTYIRQLSAREVLSHEGLCTASHYGRQIGARL